jgi:hypothetical protein
MVGLGTRLGFCHTKDQLYDRKWCASISKERVSSTISVCWLSGMDMLFLAIE